MNKGTIVKSNTETIIDNANNEREYCVVCGKKTQYFFKDPIGRRKYYIEGSGQLCEDCYFDLYLKGRNKQ